MEIKDFFLDALRAEAHHHRVWCLKVFTVSKGENDIAYDIIYTDKGVEGVTPNGRVQLKTFTNGPEPLINHKDLLTLNPGDLANVKETVFTSYGTAFFNAYAIITAFGDKLDYINETSKDSFGYSVVDIKKVESMIIPRLVNNPEGTLDRQAMLRDKDKIYVAELIDFSTYVNALGSLGHLWIKAISPRSLTTHPDVRKRRAELLEQYKDQLSDPAIQALIQDELIKLDKEWIFADDTADFYIDENKDFNTARKRQYLIHGPEAGFSNGTDAPLVVNSLNEGWDITRMKEMVNSVRAGSYGRGAETALGGESVKFFLRVFQNSRMVDEDCKTKIGWLVYISQDMVKEIVGFQHKVGDKWVDTTTENNQALLGKVIELRTPLFCKASHSDFCRYCIGAMNTSNPNGISSSTTQVGSEFMDVAMQSAHAKELKTSTLRFDLLLS